MPIIRNVLATVFVLLAVLFMAIIALYKFIDDKTIEEKTLAAIESTLQRKVIVKSHFALTRSLHPTLRTGDVSIASANWDSQPYLLQAEEFEIGLNLLSLLRGVVSIENVVFHNAQINSQACSCMLNFYLNK